MNDLTRVSVGLFVAFAVHDAEELVTMAPTSRRVLSRTPTWVPIPDDLRTRGVSQSHVNVGIGIMAALVAGTAVAGVRTQGRSAWFRGGLLAFGAHGLTHLASAVASREYTTGVATSPTIVIPFWLWARRVLRRNGIREHDAKSTAVAISVFPLLLAVHVVTRLILGQRSLGSSPVAERPAQQSGQI